MLNISKNSFKNLIPIIKAEQKDAQKYNLSREINNAFFNLNEVIKLIPFQSIYQIIIVWIKTYQ